MGRRLFPLLDADLEPFTYAGYVHAGITAAVLDQRDAIAGYVGRAQYLRGLDELEVTGHANDAVELVFAQYLVDHAPTRDDEDTISSGLRDLLYLGYVAVSAFHAFEPVLALGRHATLRIVHAVGKEKSSLVCRYASKFLSVLEVDEIDYLLISFYIPTHLVHNSFSHAECNHYSRPVKPLLLSQPRTRREARAPGEAISSMAVEFSVEGVGSRVSEA